VIAFADDALADLERIFEFNNSRDAASTVAHINGIRGAIQILNEHPEIGRRLRAGSSLRELVISYGKTGYIALYEFSPVNHVVRVVAIRHQREAGYRGLY
jgi:plasmid stabilization system protein ParE